MSGDKLQAGQQAAGVGKHALKNRKDDFYPTPPEATRALMHRICVPRRIWEPACGDGAIVSVLRAEFDCTVTATDLVDRACPDSESAIDFLLEQSAPDGVEAIVTNPPFKLANEFVRHALKLVPDVYMFLRLQFLEGAGRGDLIDTPMLQDVMPFRERVPRMHREGYAGPKNHSAIAFAWFHWRRDRVRGATEMHRLSCRDVEWHSELDWNPKDDAWAGGAAAHGFGLTRHHRRRT